MIDKLVQLHRRLRRAVSRTRWTARLLGRPHASASDEPGLILLQIDGLARRQFEQALQEGRLPFLEKMHRRGHYETISFYSGCPSTTPAVQGEVMYGVRCAVPAFQFFDRQRGQVVRMFDSDTAHAVAERLAAQADPLLRGGNSYSNIYRGGAAEARFCAETLETDKKRLTARPLRYAAIAALYSPTILRVTALALLEFVIAVGDVVRGIIQREDVRTELKFIVSRVGVSIVLREYVRVMTKLAIESGSPIVYANFLGYDEQAHRRGPGSWFAHWVLKGVDNVIADVSRTARRSPLRDYETIVFSDHGQETTKFYDDIHGRSIDDAVKESLVEGSLAGDEVNSSFPTTSGSQALDERARRLLGIRRGRTELPHPTAQERARQIVVTALGPLGYVYTPTPLTDAAKEHYARRLVTMAHVPLVLFRDSGGVVRARNRQGRWTLPAEAAKVLGPDHPFLPEAVADLVAVCHHPDTGDLVISGWTPDQPPVTFVRENGSHGSVGHDEMRGFALIPDGVPVPRRRNPAGESYIRGEDLYWAGREFLGAPGRPADRPIADGAKPTAPTPAAEPSSTFRVMTYNIHSCIGLDGRVRPERILQVIRTAGADVIALQEVDSNRARSRHADQARFLAERLQMSHHYYAVFEAEQEQYGLAVISRWPLRHIQSTHLTPADHGRRREARGALWVEIETPWGPVDVINTHFGLTRQERRDQAALLVGDQWLGRLAPDRPAILCGDLNAGPSSPAYKLIAARLHDAQRHAPGHRPANTFPSIVSLRRLDHVFINNRLQIRSLHLPRTPTAVVASDHLPLCADLAITPHR